MRSIVIIINISHYQKGIYLQKFGFKDLFNIIHFYQKKCRLCHDNIHRLRQITNKNLFYVKEPKDEDLMIGQSIFVDLYYHYHYLQN